MTHPYAPFKVQADGQHLGPGAVYHGGVLLASGGTATVLLYDGDNTSGVLIASFRIGDGLTDTQVHERGVRLLYGLYVDIGSNVGAFTLFHDPAPAE